MSDDEPDRGRVYEHPTMKRVLAGSFVLLVVLTAVYAGYMATTGQSSESLSKAEFQELRNDTIEYMNSNDANESRISAVKNWTYEEYQNGVYPVQESTVSRPSQSASSGVLLQKFGLPAGLLAIGIAGAYLQWRLTS